MESNGVVARPRNIPFEPNGKVLSLEVLLDRRDGPSGVGVYAPGDLLTGHVRLDLSQRLTVKNIDLLVQGTGNAACRQRSMQGEEVVTDDEVYINEIAELVGKRSNEMVTLSAGEHIFPFACDLPWELPGTFTGTHGNVSYLVKVVIQAEMNETVHREPCIATTIFLVESRLSLEGMSDHLNSYRIDYKHPVKTSALATGSSSIKVSLFMPRRAYDIGDHIRVNMSLTNTSKRAVTSMSLALVMEATYRVRDRTTVERLLVTDHDDEFTVRHLESRQWRHVGLTVPRCIPPSGLPHSTLMDIKYWLVFKAELERAQENVLLQTPVIIGLELPDEMKLSAAALEGSFSEVTAARSETDGASGRLLTSRILYQGSREPPASLPANSQPQSPAASAALQQPLYIDVRKPQPQQPPLQPPQQRSKQQHSLPPPMPQTHYQPVRQQQPPQGSPRDSDTQVISMRFTDELDEHSPYGQPYHLQQQPQPKMSRNPLFTPDSEDANGYHEVIHERRFDNGGHDSGDQALSALDTHLHNGAEEVLY